MHIVADVNKISKTVQRKFTFIINVLSKSDIHFYLVFNSSCEKECWYFHMKWFYQKCGCLTGRNYAGTCKDICSYNLMYNFLIQLLPLKGLVFVGHFLIAFLHGNETFPNGSSQYEIVPHFVVFHSPYSKYKGFKKMLLSKSRFFTRVALVSFVQHSRRTCVTHVASFALVLHPCRLYCTRVARVWLSCCKLDQI